MSSSWIRHWLLIGAGSRGIGLCNTKTKETEKEESGQIRNEWLKGMVLHTLERSRRTIPPADAPLGLDVASCQRVLTIKKEEKSSHPWGKLRVLLYPSLSKRQRLLAVRQITVDMPMLGKLMYRDPWVGDNPPESMPQVTFDRCNCQSMAYGGRKMSSLLTTLFYCQSSRPNVRELVLLSVERSKSILSEPDGSAELLRNATIYWWIGWDC